MCGFIGRLSYTSAGDTSLTEFTAFDEGRFSRRGPDEIRSLLSKDQSLHLRFSRLAISGDGENSQPIDLMVEDAQHLFCFNGEVYNSQDLKARFDLASEPANDAHVFLELILKIGLVEALVQIRGMFAGAYYDGRAQRLAVFRDRFGIKPVFLSQTDRDTIVFGSEVSFIAQFKSLTINAEAAKTFLNTSRLDGNENFYREIEEVVPGTAVFFEKGHAREVVRWFDPVCLFQHDQSASGQFLEKLEQSFEEHTQSDVRNAIALSSGVDSNLIARFFQRKAIPADLFCFYFPEFDAGEYGLVASDYSHPDFRVRGVEVSVKDLESEFERVMLAQAMPFGGVPTLGMHFLYQRAAMIGVKVMYTGIGIDDYIPSSRREFSALEGYVLGRDTALSGVLEADGSPRIMVLRDPVKSQCTGVVGHYRELLGERLANKLIRNLRYDDRNAASWSIENRVPFLCHELVSCGLSMSPRELYGGGTSKRFLRDHLSSLGGGLNVVSQPKKSIQSPQGKILLKSPFFQSLVDDALFGSNEMEKLIKLTDLRKQWKRALKTNELHHSGQLWDLLSVNWFVRRYGIA